MSVIRMHSASVSINSFMKCIWRNTYRMGLDIERCKTFRFLIRIILCSTSDCIPLRNKKNVRISRTSFMSIPQGLIRVIWEQSETSFCLCVFLFWSRCEMILFDCNQVLFIYCYGFAFQHKHRLQIGYCKKFRSGISKLKKKRFVRRKKNDKHHVLPIVPIKYFMKGNTWSINQTNWINYSHWFLLIKLQILPDSLFLY